MPLNKRALCQLGAIILVCVLGAACSPAAPVPTPTASTPRPSRTQATETQIERDMRLDFEAAERAYRAFRGEYSRISVAGGSLQVSSLMRANAGGPYLKAYTGFLEARRRNGWRSSQGVRIAYVHRAAYFDQEVTLQSCEDGSKSKLLDKTGKTIRAGSVQLLTLHVRPVKGAWKVWNGDQKEVKSCEG